MNLIRYNNPSPSVWSPFDRLSSLRDLLDSAFQLASYSPSTGGGWVPLMDVEEDDDKVTVTLEAAGMKAGDFDLSLQDGTLTISGERKAESVKREGESFRSERVFGKFTRSVSLPSPVHADGVKADYTDGVLTVTLPKAEEAKPRKIAVG